MKWKRRLPYGEREKRYAIYQKILDALKLFRKYTDHTIYARVNFSCCSSCGSYELATKCKETGNHGYVFWNRQTEQHYWEEYPAGKAEIYFQFCSIYGNNENSDTHVPTVLIGEILVKSLKDSGLHPKWSGDSSDCVLISQETEENQPLDVESCLSDRCTD